MTQRSGCWILTVATLAFFATWWNGYVPPTSGGEAVSMASWAHDYLPYRDYFSQAPPAMPMMVQGIVAVAGPHLIATMTFGAIVRTLAAVALYFLLLRVARPGAAAIAVLTAVVVSSADDSDTTFYYNHVGASCVVIAVWLASVSAERGRMFGYAAGVGAGFLLAWAVAVKQTIVFGAFAGTAAALLLALPRPRAGWIVWLSGLFVGGAGAIGSIVFWLYRNDLVGPMAATMATAAEGKGGVLRSLVRPVSQLTLDFPALVATLVAVTVIAILGTTALVWRRRQAPPAWSMILSGAIVVVVAALSALGPRGFTLFGTALGWWGSLAIGAFAATAVRHSEVDRRALGFLALAVTSFGIGYSFAVSWPLFENIAFPGLALVLVALFNVPLFRPHGLSPIGAGILCLVLLVAGVDRKITAPHTWGGWVEPPLYSERGSFDNPAFDLVRLSKPTSDLYSLVAAVAGRRSSADDRMYVFPNLPILYAIADRRPATFGLVHWVDTCPDFLGREDAARLIASPPKILIVREDPLTLIRWEEMAYRGYRRSSVRDVLAAVETIKPGYDRVAQFVEIPTNPIDIYVRRDEAATSRR